MPPSSQAATEAAQTVSDGWLALNTTELGAFAGTLPNVHYAFQVHDHPETAWRVAHVSSNEVFAAVYSLRLHLRSDQGDDPVQLLGCACTLMLRRARMTRFIHGIVAGIDRSGSPNLQGGVEVTVVPALAALRHRVDTRIFQDKTVPEVLDLVLAPALAVHRRTHKSMLRRSEYPRREYIVQHGESDLAFVHRLLGEEGIWYYFEQAEGSGEDACEQLVLIDNNEDAPQPELGDHGNELPLELERSEAGHWQAVTQLSIAERVGTEEVVVRAHNWTNPSVCELATASAENEYDRSHYEPHGVTFWNYDSVRYGRSDADEQARMRWECVQGGAESLRGRGNVIGMAPGQRVRVRGASDGLDGEWIITAVYVGGSDAGHGGDAVGFGEDYSNTFTAQRMALPLRPRRYPKRRAHGISLGHVVGADGRTECGANGDDIHTDEHGRIRVKMTWDRTECGAQDATVTCFLRVAQLWSGQRWGSFFLPRIGMEVTVAFVDGDPDRPLVTGCVYNGLAQLPYDLKTAMSDKTKSYIRTQSSPGGNGYNELLFDDAAGKELVALRAQRDHVENVLHNQAISVGADRSEQVIGNETVEIQGTRVHTVHGADNLRIVDGSSRLVEVSGEETKLIAKNREIVVSGATKETHVGGRHVTVQTDDRLEVADGANKRDHVSGQYNIVADEHFKVKQGSDELYIKDAFYVSSQGGMQLKNSGFHLEAKPDGSTTIDVGKELTIRVGAATIQLKSDGTIAISGAREAKLASGPSQLLVSPASAELSAPQATVSGTATVALQGTLITLN